MVLVAAKHSHANYVIPLDMPPRQKGESHGLGDDTIINNDAVSPRGRESHMMIDTCNISDDSNNSDSSNNSDNSDNISEEKKYTEGTVKVNGSATQKRNHHKREPSVSKAANLLGGSMGANAAGLAQSVSNEFNGANTQEEDPELQHAEAERRAKKAME